MTNGYGLYYIEDGNPDYQEGVVVWILAPHAVALRCVGFPYDQHMYAYIRIWMQARLQYAVRRVRDFATIEDELERRAMLIRRRRVIEERATGRVMIPQHAESRRRRTYAA